MQNNAPVVKHLSGWHTAAQQIQEGLRTAHVPMLAASLRCTIPWVERGKVYIEMRQAGVWRLKVSRWDRVANILQVFPGANGLVEPLRQQGMLIHTLLR